MLTVTGREREKIALEYMAKGYRLSPGFKFYRAIPQGKRGQRSNVGGKVRAAVY